MHKKVDRDAKRREEKRQESLSIGGGIEIQREERPESRGTLRSRREQKRGKEAREIV